MVAVAVSPTTRIISFTVTEAGYYLDAQHLLDWANCADLCADRAAILAGQTGRTLYGGLVSILRARMRAGAGPVTLMNCDNLRHNGERARSGLLQFIQSLDDSALHAWVQANTTSPNTMVDRITPRPTQAVVERVRSATGQTDPAAIMSESFIQWVIEDNFIAGRPDWEKVGVAVVQSVDAYEEAKIRLLNATHACIAWAGTLLGYRYIHESLRHTAVRQCACDYTDDVIPVLDTLERPCPIKLQPYRDAVLERFSNPAICDTNQRVAMDGYSKIPGFIVPTIRERLALAQRIDGVAMLPALFLAYLQRWHVGQIPYTYHDQAMRPELAHAMCQAPDVVAAFCADTSLWGDLAGNLRLVDAVRRARERVDCLVTAHAGTSSQPSPSPLTPLGHP